MEHSIGLRVGKAAAVMSLLLLAVACGGGPGGTSAAPAGSPGSADDSASEAEEATIDPATADATVKVTLKEWTVVPESAQVAAGVIAFEVTNEGRIVHEFVVVKADRAESLATRPNGAVAESGLPSGAFAGEIEDIAPGTTRPVALRLQPGTYVLFCNVDDDTGVHFMEGMHTTFTVT
jgi:uncharacterized cupredoxin-like copper-binding protein